MRDSPRFQKPAYFALGLIMVLAIWSLDRLAAYQVSLSIFYLLPIGLVAWYCGGAWGYIASFISAAAWLQADLATPRVYSHWIIPYWNAMVRFLFFVVVTGLANLTVRLRRLSDQEHAVSELKSDMVSLVSHEFGNFLATFKLSLTILKESEDADESVRRQRCYATLERVYTHLANAVANFLNLNRIESGRFIPHLKETPLRTLIHATISQLGPVIENSNVAIQLDFPSQGVSVKADPDALSVVMSNLIGNAFKYTSAGGTVTVRIVADAALGIAHISVEDTGIGIAKADRRLIASGYHRTERGRQVAKGFGVGLKVTRELLESQGTQLGIKSEPGDGSNFSFRLPLWNA